MNTFKDAVCADNLNVFLNCNEFAERRTVVYDGETYARIPLILSGSKEQTRRQLRREDHVLGLYLVSAVLHCMAADMGGKQPEKGQRIKIDDGGGFFRDFYVASSVCEYGMLKVGLEAIDE